MNNEEKILEMLANLTATVVQIQGEQQKTNQRLGNLEQGQAKLEQGQAKLEQGQAKLEQDVTEIKKDVIETKNRVVLIETVLNQKAVAALDGYALLYGIANEIREDVAYLKKKDLAHDMELLVLRER